MTRHGRALFVFCLVAFVAGCSNADHLLLEERTREVERLRRQLADNEGLVNRLRAQIAARQNEFESGLLIAEAEITSGTYYVPPAPDLEGKVVSVSGRLCTIVVTSNPGNADVKAAITRMPFRFAIYDEDGYKAEAVATKYEAATKTALCQLMYTKGEAKIAVGDKAATEP